MDKKKKIVYIYFLLLPIIDLITSLMTHFGVDLSLGMIIKGLTLAVICVNLLFTKSKYKKISLIYMAILILFGCLYFISKIEVFSLSFFKTEIISALKYFYLPVMLVGVVNLFDDFKIDNKLLRRVLVINMLTYSVLMILPWITNTSFNSYLKSNTYGGVKGWFYAANEIGAILVMLLSMVYHVMDNNKKWLILLSIPILLSVSLIGTKVSFFGMIIMVICIIVIFMIKNKKGRFLLPIILVVCLGACSLFSPTLENVRALYLNKSKPATTTTVKKPTTTTQNNSKNVKLSTYIKNPQVLTLVKVVFNGRESAFLRNFFTYKDSGAKNILLGLSWSDRSDVDYTYEGKLIEVDLLDIVIHYGIVGLIVFLIPLIYCAIKLIKNIKYMNSESSLYLLTVLLAIAMSVFAGHILSAPAVSIYIVIFILMICNEITMKKEL